MSKGVTNKNRSKYMKRATITNGLTDKIMVYYNNFMRCNDIDKNISNIIDIIDIDKFVEKEIRIQELFPTVKAPAESECVAILSSIWKTPALHNAHSHEYQWFKRLINIVENIPICITLSSAKKEYHGFPLLYINKQFESMTGYNKNEIIGRNCKFLQPTETIPHETPQYSLMNKSLREGLSTSIIITNVRKNGEIFYNLLSLKPIFDAEGNYIYCMGIQTEITTDTITHTRAQNVVDVLNILCS